MPSHLSSQWPSSMEGLCFAVLHHNSTSEAHKTSLPRGWYLQVSSSSLILCSSSSVASLCSFWRRRWASTPARAGQLPGRRSAPCSRVKARLLALPHIDSREVVYGAFFSLFLIFWTLKCRTGQPTGPAVYTAKCSALIEKPTQSNKRVHLVSRTSVEFNKTLFIDILLIF